MSDTLFRNNTIDDNDQAHASRPNVISSVSSSVASSAFTS